MFWRFPEFPGTPERTLEETGGPERERDDTGGHMVQWNIPVVDQPADLTIHRL